MGTYFARSSLFTQTSGIIHRGKMCSKQPIKTLLKRQNKYRKIKSTLAISKAQSQVNNFTNLVHAPSVHVHWEKVLTSWLRNSIKLYYKESVTADILKNFAKFTGKSLCQGLLFNKNDSNADVSLNFEKFLRTPFLKSSSGRLPSNYTFIERKTLVFRTKTLRINASEIMVLIKKNRYLPHFL